MTDAYPVPHDAKFLHYKTHSALTYMVGLLVTHGHVFVVHPDIQQVMLSAEAAKLFVEEKK
jgi:hypothetical protein